MARIVSVSVSEEDFLFIKSKKLSPTDLFRHSVDRVRNKLGDGFYNGQQKELEEKLQKLNDRFMDANEFINLHGLGDQYVVHIEKQEDYKRRIRRAQQETDDGDISGSGFKTADGEHRASLLEVPGKD